MTKHNPDGLAPGAVPSRFFTCRSGLIEPFVPYLLELYARLVSIWSNVKENVFLRNIGSQSWPIFSHGSQKSPPRSIRPVFVIASLCLAIFVVSQFAGCLLHKSAGENVILITIDTLRADHLGCYGYPRATSPKIDEFAQKSFVFTQCVSQATATSASHASILTSLHPPAHGVIQNSLRLSPKIPSLVRVFRDNDYHTGAFVSSVVVSARFGLDQGFQEYDDRLDSVELNRSQQGERRADSTTDAAMKWIEERGDEKFFLWIHYIDPHGAYFPPEGYRKLFINDEWYSKGGELDVADNDYSPNAIPAYQVLSDFREPPYYVSQYDAEIRFVDDQIGHLLRFLERTNLMSKTIIAVTSDHGETLTEREYCFSHGTRTYDEQAQIPLILYFPDLPARKRVDDQVREIDILPTILDKLRIKNPFPVHGQSLIALIRGDRDHPEKAALIFSDYGSDLYDSRLGAQRSIRTEEWKFTRNSWDGSEELYNLKSDPLEKRNLAEKKPEVLGQMRKLFNEWEKNIKQVEVLRPELSKETLEQLESLGYLVK